MQVLILRPYRKDNIYFRTIEEREKIDSIYRPLISCHKVFCFFFKFLASLPHRIYGTYTRCPDSFSFFFFQRGVISFGGIFLSFPFSLSGRLIREEPTEEDKERKKQNS